jgi:hypothetical protein
MTIKKFLIVLIIILHSCSLSLDHNFYIEAASDGTYVGGKIRTDTTWTKENSPYILEDNIRIPPSVKLKICEGVQVDFSIWSFIVEGSLRVRGTADELVFFNISELPLTGYDEARIHFTDTSIPWSEQQNIRSCLLEYVEFYYANYTVNNGLIEGGAPKIDHCIIYGAEYMHSKYYAIESDGVVTNCLFDGVSKGILMGDGTIKYNKFLNTKDGAVISIINGEVRDNIIDGGIKGINVRNAVVTNNTIMNMEKKGINIFNDQGASASEVLKPWITENIIMKCGEDAITIQDDVRPRIYHNVVTENKNGIRFLDDAFEDGKQPMIKYNLFYNNDNNIYSEREDPRIKVDVKENWWGTNDTDIIDEKIFDEKDDPHLVEVIYIPYLVEPPIGGPKITSEIIVNTIPNQISFNQAIEISGKVEPPFQIYNLQIACFGPHGESWQKDVETDLNGLFSCYIIPESPGIWSITVIPDENTIFDADSVENTQINVTKIQSMIDCSTSSEVYFEGDIVQVNGLLYPFLSGEKIMITATYPDGSEQKWFTYTNEEGKFEYTFTDTGHINYEATFWWTGNEIYQKTSETIDIRLHRPSGLKIITEDERGYPVVGVSVSIFNPYGQGTLSGITDVNGKLGFDMIFPGNYTIQVEKESHEKMITSSIIPEGEVSEIVIKIDNAGTSGSTSDQISGEESTSGKNPLIYGFIPSMLIFVILITLYVVLHILNKQRN